MNKALFHSGTAAKGKDQVKAKKGVHGPTSGIPRRATVHTPSSKKQVRE